MEKIKTSAIAGTFFPAQKQDLENLISTFKKSPYDGVLVTRAVIVPHAGLIYSGDLAYQGINLLDRNIKKIFIFAPCHRVPVQEIALCTYDKIQTPLGEVRVSQKICEELSKKFNIEYNDEAFQNEHAVEIQLPLIQKVFGDIEVVPVLVGSTSVNKISDIIGEYYQDKEVGIIISSDLSHFLTDNRAKALDNKTAEMIETGAVQGFAYEQACGAVGIVGLTIFALKNNFSLLRVGMMNSGEVSGDKDRVVGYGCWALYEGERNDFIKEYYSEYLLDIARKSIEYSNSPVLDNVPVLEQMGACFVTLNKQGRLRGCIGSIIAHRPLIEDLISHSRNAAYSDPRFSPVGKEEIPQLEIAISILTSPVEIDFDGEEDLLAKIVQGEDGIIISDMGMQSVYLPSVWEQIPDKTTFLNSLKVKAGLPEHHFSETFKAYRFRTTYIKDV